MKILIVNGPNLNLLGKRDPSIYGSQTLKDIENRLKEECRLLGAEPTFYQSNSEGDLIDKIQSAISGYDGLILNAGAYSHTGHAIADALECVPCVKIEVHLSNIYARTESFRHTSVLSRAVNGVICGLGAQGYSLAVLAIVDRCNKK